MLCYLLYQLRREPAGLHRRNDTRRHNRRRSHRLCHQTVTGTIKPEHGLRPGEGRGGEGRGRYSDHDGPGRKYGVAAEEGSTGDPRKAGEVVLKPEFQYTHPDSCEKRSDDRKIDVAPFEFRPSEAEVKK